MARKPAFIFWGQSNMEGYAPLSAVPAATFNRWTGQNSLGTTYPISQTMPDVKVWTPRLPFLSAASIITKTATVFGAATVTITGYNPGVDFLRDQTIYIPAGNGQGQWRRITGNTAAADTVVTVTPAWTTVPTNGSTIEVWTTAGTIASISGTTLVKTNFPAVFASTYVNKWIVILSGAALGEARRIVTTDSNDTATLESAFTVTPAANDTFVIYDGAATVDTVGTYTSANGAWRDLSFKYDVRPVYTDGFGYPNFKSWPRIGPTLHLVGGATFNAMVEAAWQLQNFHGEPIYCIHLGIGASLMSPYHSTLGLADFSWFDDAIHNDWHPSSSSDLLSILLSTVLVQANAALGSDTLDVRGIFSLEGETDANNAERAALAGGNMALIRETMRNSIVSGGFTTLSADKIPFIIQKIRTTSNMWAYASTVNPDLVKIVNDDPYSGFIETDDVTVNAGDAAHYDGSATGQILVGQRFAQSWQETVARESDPTRPIDERPTLSTIRTQVLRRYEGQSASNDASTNRLNQFINDSLREVYNTLGDNAWFLRRTETLTTSTIFPNTLTLPRTAKRLLWIESQACPGRKVVWKGISLTDQGRVNITLHDAGGSPYIAHFVQIPSDLTSDTDTILLPQDYLELVVVLTCKRLAETHGNAVIAGYYNGEIQRLWKYVKKDVLRYARMAQEALTTVDAYDPWGNTSIGSGFREA